LNYTRISFSDGRIVL